MEYGYIRQSPKLPQSKQQLEDLHLPKEALYIDTCSIRDPKRPQRELLLDTVVSGDTVYVQSMDRIAKNVKDLLQVLTEFMNKGVSLHFVNENLTISQDANSAVTTTILSTLTHLTSWEKTLLRELQEEGKAAARLAGKHFGRPTSVTEAQKEEVKRLILEENNKSVLQISKETGVPRTTCYRIKDALKRKLEEEANTDPNAKHSI